MDNELLRADVALVRRGLAPSRERAQALIAGGLAYHNGHLLSKPAQKIAPEDEVRVLGSDRPYVSRGGLKLEKALKVFGVAAEGVVALDVGASTGGFTDVLLQNGAAKVYAVDVGHDQLDPSLRGHPRVVSMEGINARCLPVERFNPLPTLAVMDVSFISIRLILPGLFSLLGENGRVLALIKPQFEAGRANIGKGGVVTKPGVHEAVLQSMADFVPTLGWKISALDFSPIAGGDGNLEFLADMLPAERAGTGPTPEEIRNLVKAARAALAGK